MAGHYCQPDGGPIPLSGRASVSWGDDWFQMTTKLTLAADSGSMAIAAGRSETMAATTITAHYRGRVAPEDQGFTYGLNHSQLGQGEGQVWIAPMSMMFNFSALMGRNGENQRCSGVETLFQLSPDCYCWTHGIYAGHQLLWSMEAVLRREA
jgi:hypothetical protein